MTSQIRSLSKLVSRSPVMHAVFDMVCRFAPTEVSVTLIGETGTGKDVLAHVLHENSARGSGPFVIFDCGAVAPNLAESELLGHERGAFTGAHSTHVGAFERANGGTLFLDEIGELPLELQPRLLRALENRKIRRVGGTQYRPVDVRILAATHRDLRSDVTRGGFRQDLYFRLAAAVVPVPSLRERLEDLPLLVERLLGDLGKGDLRMTEGALAELATYSWPGNVRELKNGLAFAAAFVDPGAKVIDVEHVRRIIAEHPAAADAVDLLPLAGQKLEDIERAAIRQTLARTGGNKVRASQMLGIAPSTLYEKLKKYGIEEP